MTLWQPRQRRSGARRCGRLDGALGTIYRGWADRLRLLLAEQEALIDFPDEDLPPEVEARVLGNWPRCMARSLRI